MVNDQAALITQKRAWDGYVLLELRSPRVASRAKPGQFLMVRVSSHPLPLLRRPLSIHARDGDRIGLFFARAGLGTAILADKRPGETLDVLGPLGKGFVLTGKITGKTFWLAGGGRGIAPLYFLARELQARGAHPRVFYGGKTQADLPLLSKFAARRSEVFISTDDGSSGFPGLVTEMLEKELARSARPALIFACGPDPMLKRIGEIAAEFKIPAQLSLESIMGCGIGACWGCVRKIRRGDAAEWVKVCEEGPVFRAGEVVWEKEEGNEGI